MEFSLGWVLVYVLGTMFLLMFAGTELFCAIGIAGLIGVGLYSTVIQFGVFHATQALAAIAWETSTNWTLTALPMFIFMAALLKNSGLAGLAYHFVAMWVGHFKGGLAMASVGFGAIFAAACGSSTASAAAIGLMALPEMEKRDYSRPFVMGTVAASGTLGILIPPSIAMIIYGFLTNTSVGHLFIAGIFPGLMLATMFIIYISIVTAIWPSLAPGQAKASMEDRIRSILGVLPLFLVIVCVLGSIYTGIATPTEAGAVGVGGIIVISAMCRRLTLKVLWESAWEAAKLTCVIMMIIISTLFVSL